MAPELEETSNRVRLEDHPAARAWRKLTAERVGPKSIRTLKAEGQKSAVYRLAGVGPGGCDLVAKRCLSDRGTIEWMIYRDVLPHLRISALHCHGSVADDDSRFRWIFLEDAGQEGCALESERHRALALGWLGAMHTSAQRVPAAASLPDRGATSYLELLRQAREMTREALGHPALRADGAVTLRAVIAESDILETHWCEIERFCERMPRTLVHGDFKAKNLRVRTHAARESLCVMDWEKAGWGVPAADFGECVAHHPDVTAYWSVVRDCWPHLDLADLRRLAGLGTVFRSIDGLVWTNRSFRMWRSRVGVDTDWYVEEVRWFEARLSDWMKTAMGRGH